METSFDSTITYRKLNPCNDYASSSSSSSLSSVSSIQPDRAGGVFDQRRAAKMKGGIKETVAATAPAISRDAATRFFDDLILSPGKLLDKLLIVCPNVESCQEVLPRRDLRLHLQYRCKGRKLNSHTNLNFTNSDINGERSIIEPMYLPYCPVAISEGQLTSIQIYRGTDALGISIVGGMDTPLMNVIIQDVTTNGVVDRDGRLQPGDHLLEVNGIDLTRVSHLEAVRCLSHPSTVCQLTVYREPYDHCLSRDIDQELLTVILSKPPGEQLGIKLVQKKGLPGIYILDIISGGIAHWDDRLRPDDRILRINETDTTNGTQEQAVDIIQNSMDSVELLISRSSSASHVIPLDNSVVIHNGDTGSISAMSMPPRSREKVISIVKKSSDALGVSIAGGRGSGGFDTPVYVTSLSTSTWQFSSEQLMRGDVLLAINGFNLLNLTHLEAVQLMKCCSAGCDQVLLHVLPGTETSDGPGNFRPSWKFWLSVPPICYAMKTVQLDRSPLGSLGFSIVGGYSSQSGTVPVFVKSVVRHGPAGRDGRLKSGDLILSVNGTSTDGLSHRDVVLLLTSDSICSVRLSVVSWPGSSI